MIELPPGLVLILGAVLVPFLRGWLRAAWMLALPVAAIAILYTLPDGSHLSVSAFGQSPELLRVDPLSLVFGFGFILAPFLFVIYPPPVAAAGEHVSGLGFCGARGGAQRGRAVGGERGGRAG